MATAFLASMSGQSNDKGKPSVPSVDFTPIIGRHSRTVKMVHLRRVNDAILDGRKWSAEERKLFGALVTALTATTREAATVGFGAMPLSVQRAALKAFGDIANGK